MTQNRFKLVLLGDSAVGKSCLATRFVNDDYHEFYGTWDPESQCERGKYSRKNFEKLFEIFEFFVNPNFLILS